MITIIDYDAGNLKSVQKAFEFIGSSAEVTNDIDKIKNAKAVVLPGVGAFGDSMKVLKSLNLVDVVRDTIKEGKPFLGICLGLQLLFESSEESEGVSGISAFGGKFKLLPKKPDLKVPHMGWNSIKLNESCPLFKGIKQNSFVYFVHSYYLDTFDKSIVSATTSYGIDFEVAIWSKNAFATQFHPEKSGEVGLKMLKNFISLI